VERRFDGAPGPSSEQRQLATAVLTAEGRERVVPASFVLRCGELCQCHAL
jgi:hypothetical protein